MVVKVINNNTPLISVVIPTYNHAEFLKNALEGIRGQKYSNLEVIVVDNCSEDHTDKVVESFGDLEIKLFKINNNGIIGASRNLGIDKAKGKWIAFLDSDDVWYPSRLSTCFKVVDFVSSKFDVISTDEMMVFIENGKEKILRHGPFSKNMYRDMLIFGNRLSTSATFVKKSFIARHELRFSESSNHVTAEDYDFWLHLARNNAKFIFIPSVQGNYNIHGNNASSYIDLHSAAEKCVLKKHTLELQGFEMNKRKLWRKVRSRIYLGQSLRRLRLLQFGRALLLFIKSYFLSPIGIFELVVLKIKSIKKEG